MRLVIMFDLPVKTAAQRRSATQFRNFLIQDGYTMMQYSIYVRVCNGIEAIDKHRKRVLDSVPDNGSVRLLVVTEKQYAAMEILTGDYVEADQGAEQVQLQLF